MVELELSGQASELYLSADWSRSRGDFRLAGRRFLEAARLWRDAAAALEASSTVAAIRQQINYVVTLFVSGNIPQAQAAALEMDRAIAETNVPEETRLAIQSEWQAIVRQRVSPVIEQWDKDWQDLRAEAGGTLEAVSRETAERWLQRYPSYAGAYYMGFVATDRTGRSEDARRFLEEAAFFDPDNPSFAGLLLIRTANSDDPPVRILSRITDIYDRFQNRSAKICYLYAMSLLLLSEKSMVSATQLLERAAAATDLAVHLTPSDLSPDEWAWSHVFMHYCHWRLGRPGVNPPSGRYYLWRGLAQVTVDVPSMENEHGSASRLVHAAPI